MENKKYHPSFGWITPDEFAALSQKPLAPPALQGARIRDIENKISAEKSAAKKKTRRARAG